MRKHFESDRVAGWVFMLLGVVVLVEAWRLRPLRMREVVGDDTFPTILGLSMLVLGALMAFVLKPQKTSVSWPKGQPRRAMVQSAAVMVGYWLVLPYLGYALSTFLAGVGLFRSMGYYRWRVCIPAGATLAVAFYYVFMVWLETPFPIGMLGI